MPATPDHAMMRLDCPTGYVVIHPHVVQDRARRWRATLNTIDSKFSLQVELVSDDPFPIKATWFLPNLKRLEEVQARMSATDDHQWWDGDPWNVAPPLTL